MHTHAAFHPRKSLGQNFLIHKGIVEKITASAGLTGKELVVEVGPGFGILTEALVAKARKVIAIEKDPYLFSELQKKFSQAGTADGAAKNLELLYGDALTIAPPQEPYCLIANIPYAITSPLLDHFIREQPRNLPHCAVLLVQKEVAGKICAAPPHMNVLALHVQTFGKPRLLFGVSRNNFRPAPKVDSAVIRIDFPASLQAEVKNYKKYFDLIHRGFSQKRKMLRATLSAQLLQKAGIDPTRRAETLSIDEWEILVRTH